MLALPMPMIYIVDDDDDITAAMSEALEGGGRQVRSFVDPIHALEALKDETVDLVITDLSMPWVDGDQFVHAIRSRFPHMPVLLVSGYARAQAIARQHK